ncbi:hypothetical protein INT47_004952 [Mucor saturninus]|uniref:Uncharacterized protein n=1 Tax=Mucor saturninus TaxID=64648 RepID=A0A8H7R3Z2_9FUNG|nr:hypothetical protein INT47_004952 [Mucor saturninus]
MENHTVLIKQEPETNEVIIKQECEYTTVSKYILANNLQCAFAHAAENDDGPENVIAPESVHAEESVTANATESVHTTETVTAPEINSVPDSANDLLVSNAAESVNTEESANAAESAHASTSEMQQAVKGPSPKIAFSVKPVEIDAKISDHCFHPTCTRIQKKLSEDIPNSSFNAFFLEHHVNHLNSDLKKAYDQLAEYYTRIANISDDRNIKITCAKVQRLVTLYDYSSKTFKDTVNLKQIFLDSFAKPKAPLFGDPQNIETHNFDPFNLDLSEIDRNDSTVVIDVNRSMDAFISHFEAVHVAYGVDVEKHWFFHLHELFMKDTRVSGWFYDTIFANYLKNDRMTWTEAKKILDTKFGYKARYGTYIMHQQLLNVKQRKGEDFAEYVTRVQSCARIAMVDRTDNFFLCNLFLSNLYNKNMQRRVKEILEDHLQEVHRDDAMDQLAREDQFMKYYSDFRNVDKAVHKRRSQLNACDYLYSHGHNLRPEQTLSLANHSFKKRRI